MLQSLIHYGFHGIVPLIIALLFFKTYWKKAYFIMLCGILIDVDHLLANPLFETNRCSINFHPLHSYIAIAIYILLLLPKNLRLIGLGLVIHIIADTIDCILM